MRKLKIDSQPVGPFPGMIVGAMRNEKPTYTTVGAGGCACMDPVLCVSLKNTHYITPGISQSGYFSVNIPPTALLKEIDFCGTHSGYDTDKSVLFTTFFDPAGLAPMIHECSMNFLCKVYDAKEVRGFTMFFGDIVAAFANENCMTDSKIDPAKLDPIILLSHSYCSLKDVIGYPFTEWKKLNL